MNYERRGEFGWGTLFTVESYGGLMQRLLQAQLKKNTRLLVNEAKHADGFMRLLMKHRNTGDGWTREERCELKGYLRRFAAYVPVLFVFLLPFGMLLVPVLAEIMDRRREPRNSSQS
jgi:hypothetical protein